MKTGILIIGEYNFPLRREHVERLVTLCEPLGKTRADVIEALDILTHKLDPLRGDRLQSTILKLSRFGESLKPIPPIEPLKNNEPFYRNLPKFKKRRR